MAKRPAKRQPTRTGPRTLADAKSAPAKWSLSPRWLGLLLAVTALVAYLPAIRGGFIWDDDDYVTNNLTLRSIGGLAKIWADLSATPQYYPLVHTGFWLEYHLWGLNPLGYHVVNVLLHVLAAQLLWRVLVTLQLPGAWLAAGIFALHPVAVESVAWVTERKNVQSAVFYFAAAITYLRWTETTMAGQKPVQFSMRWYFIALALFIAALLSKTTACSLPAALLLVFWWKRGRIVSREVWPLLPFFIVGAGLSLVTAWVERNYVGALGPEWAFSISERCLIAGRVTWFYAEKLFWPVNLTFIYPRWQINTAEWWQWMFPMAALAVVLGLWHWRHRIGRGPLVAVLFFIGTLFPALGFTNVYPMRFSFVADHFQYLASVGLIVLAVAGLRKICRPFPLTAALLPVGLAVLTWTQSHIYANQEILWQDTLAKNPGCWMAHNCLGMILAEHGRMDEAMREFQTTIRLKPDHADAHYNLGKALDMFGEIDEAIREYRETIRLKPGKAAAHNNLGAALLNQGKIEEAIHECQEAIRLNPANAEAHNNLASAYFNKGKIDDAISQYQEALRLKPDFAEAHNNLGTSLLNKNQIDAAIGQYQEALRLKPDYAQAQANLAHALEIKKTAAGR